MGQGGKQPGLKQLMEGFSLVCKSPYLLSISLFLMLSSSVSSFMYFQRSLVVAAASNAASSRVAIFASMSGASALGIAALQLLATVRETYDRRGHISATSLSINRIDVPCLLMLDAQCCKRCHAALTCVAS